MYVCHVQFLNRTAELERLTVALSRSTRQFLVVYGRRRCGKSTLLRRLSTTHRTCYFLATEGAAALQRSLLAEQLGTLHPGFEYGQYPTWSALWRALIARGGERYVLILDEFPYLVQAAVELTSTLQALLEDRAALPFDLVVCGSSQQMMEDAVLRASAPLYGRADEVIRVQPLRVGYLPEAFPELAPVACIEEFAMWGGVPRYWELRGRYETRHEALRQLLLTPMGLLREEPRRLLVDDLTRLASPLSLLTLVANGVHRVSELGGRLQRTAADLTRPLSRLVELGYLRREVPYGESPRRSKQTLYTVRDPFMRFYFRFVAAEASRIEADRVEEIAEDIAAAFPGFVSDTWEELCRASVRAGALGREYDACSRWWGTTTERQRVELDGVSRSRDGRRLLLLECKWSDNVDAEREHARLRSLAQQLPFYAGEEVVTVVAGKDAVERQGLRPQLTPTEVLGVLR